MCGRFAFYSPAEAAVNLFGVQGAFEADPRYNIAPTQYVVAVRDDADGQREAVNLKWGLIPFWAKEPSIGNRMINARAEAVAEPRARTAARAIEAKRMRGLPFQSCKARKCACVAIALLTRE